MSEGDDENNVNKKPLSPKEVRRRLNDPNTVIVPASQAAVDELAPYVDRVLAAVEEILDIGDAWVSDESYLSDFFATRDSAEDAQLYARFSEKLGITLDPGNPDDRYIVKIARRLKQQASA